jgi:cyclopropane-fatty-acyl-phospholipid synthase
MSEAVRIESLKRLLVHVRERLGLDIGFVLWDGSTVPADLGHSGLAFAIADEGVIAALIRAPNLDTIINLWVTARLDIRNGTFFDVVARRPKFRTRETLKTLDKGLALRTLARFLFVPRGGPWPLEAIKRAQEKRDGTEQTNRENIQYHYDLSNAFYALFLDPEMVYSCGYFTDPANDLAAAQRDKLDMICRKLRLKSGETLLDIGCGWGGLICHAARHYGVRAVGATLAKEQYDYAKAKIERLGLGDRVTLEFRDYTKMEGTFDKIASIGMFEHVGIANYPTYYQTVHRLLRPRGLYLHHTIARRAPHGKRRREETAYKALGRYIFPGGELDHLGMSIENLERYGFEVHDVEGWREHYAKTLRHWHDRLKANEAAAEREVGVMKTRLWLSFFAGGSIAFERGALAINQTLVSKRARGASGLPPTRADLYR